MADIQPGRWRHFKGNEYQVLCVARHSETQETMVVYRALYGDGGVCGDRRHEVERGGGQYCR